MTIAGAGPERRQGGITLRHHRLRRPASAASHRHPTTAASWAARSRRLRCAAAASRPIAYAAREIAIAQRHHDLEMQQVGGQVGPAGLQRHGTFQISPRGGKIALFVPQQNRRDSAGLRRSPAPAPGRGSGFPAPRRCASGCAAGRRVRSRHRHCGDRRPAPRHNRPGLRHCGPGRARRRPRPASAGTRPGCSASARACAASRLLELLLALQGQAVMQPGGGIARVDSLTARASRVDGLGAVALSAGAKRPADKGRERHWDRLRESGDRALRLPPACPGCAAPRPGGPAHARSVTGLTAKGFGAFRRPASPPTCCDRRFRIWR